MESTVIESSSTHRSSQTRSTSAYQYSDVQNLHQNILSTIGNTPVVRLNKLGPDHVDLYAKVEAFNPLGSVKDRLALGVIEAAERDGSLQPGQTVVEATSGNTGIGLAMVCAQKGYPLVVVMAENFSVERRRLMRYLGARVVLTPASDMGTGMLRKAIELAESHGWFLCNQFSNEANADFHSTTTARELLRDFPNGSLDYYVTGFGTGGTLKGVARELRRHSPSTRVIAAEPDNSPILGSGIKQQFDAHHHPIASHPEFRPHVMQGWSPDFVSRLTADAVDGDLVDELVPVSGETSMMLARELARQEGIFCGTSAGATLAAALSVAERAEPGSSIVCMLPDTGERYLSTPLFDDISEEMTEQELELSKSTPGYRFDVSDTPDDAPDDGPDDGADETVPDEHQNTPKPEAVAYLEQVLNSPEDPVVVFSLEWCEFCWSVNKLFDRLNIRFKVIPLDSVDYQKDNWGGEVRKALDALTGVPTIPQVFIGGTHMGGCTDTFDAYIRGDLQSVLNDNGIEWKDVQSLDPYSMLPKWLQPR